MASFAVSTAFVRIEKIRPMNREAPIFDSHESGIFLSDFIKNKSFLHPAFPLGVPGYGKDLMACFPDYRESPFWGKKKSDDINEA